MKSYLTLARVLALICSVSVAAQTQIPRSVLGNGGEKAANDQFAVAGTVGQSAVGTATSNANQIQSGFWPQAPKEPVAVEASPENLPGKFRLDQNYPNPFWSAATSPAFGGGNPATTIRFALPRAELVTLKIFDVHGREVATLVNEKMPGGEHSLNLDGRLLSSGIYFYQLRAGEFVQKRKLALVK